MALKARLLFYLVIAIGSFTGASQSLAQDSVKTGFLDYAKAAIVHYAKHAFNLGFSFIQAPLHFDGGEWQNVLYTGVGTSALFLVDPTIKEFALRSRSNFNDKIFQIDDYLNGDKGTYAAAGIFLTGFLIKEEKVRLAGLYAAETIFLARSITSLLKYTFGRRRPYGGKDHMDFKLIRGTKQKYKSFPSGHTTGAFAFASIMAMSVDNIYWKTGWYGSATLVGLARIYHNVHWLSDTFLAGIISYNVAKYVVNFENRQKDETSKYSFRIYPTQTGITAMFRF